MSKITLKQAAAWCGGTVDEKYEDVTFFGAGNDTRTIQPGELFVVLQGARDGHDFIPAAMEKGAAAALCSRRVGDYPAIYVDDPRIALGLIASHERERLGMTVVGITGSVGKSTTKEMVAHVLESTFRTGKTPVNHNNDIGMPMAILAMEADTQVAVLEMGMNHFREMAYLSQIARPDIAAIVNIGTMHIEFLGTVEGIRKAKMEILEGMDPSGKLLLNGDDTMLSRLSDIPVQEITYFGSGENCAVRASDIEQQEGLLSFTVSAVGESARVEMALEGTHFVADAMAAAAVGRQLGISLETIARQLSSFRNMAGRQETIQAAGCTIIKDYYNAGPESMEAALQVLGRKAGRRIAVLGDMLELGVCTEAEHYRVGRIAAEKADLVFAYGPNSPRIINGCRTGGLEEPKAKAFTEKDALAQTLKRVVKPGDTILIKGSRGMHMEKILEAFLAEER